MTTRRWILLLGSLFVLLCVLSIFVLAPHGGAASAEIWSEGKLVKTVSLMQNQSFVIESTNGANTVTVQGGKIAVTQATCPDHYCMKRGQCDSGPDIICLPNRLVIKFSQASGLDAVAGQS